MSLRASIVALACAALGCAGKESQSPDVAAPCGTGAGATDLPTSFAWSSTGPLVSPVRDASHPILSVKDPSVVYFGDRWHVFATTANESASWSMVYLSFARWADAGSALPHYLDQNPALVGYHAAPQVFFFTPQRKWYLIFQSGQPQYSTNDDITKPEAWTTPTNFFPREPATVTENKGEGGWLDFWVICDAAACYLFFTDDNGTFYRSRTGIEQFPAGFEEPVVAMKGTKETLFEGSSTYRVKGTDRYLTLVEAFGPSGSRYYRSFVADALDGEWTPLADSWENPFAGPNNVTFEDGVAWTRDVSHGEMLRDGYDETLTLAPDGLCFLYQGVDPAQTGVEYYRLPYRLALLRSAP